MCCSDVSCYCFFELLSESACMENEMQVKASCHGVDKLFPFLKAESSIK